MWIIRGFLFIPLVLVCFALSPTVRAQLSPAPDGGYPNGNTAEGDSALFSLTTGTNNTANGFGALYTNTAGIYNTANGSKALYSNTTINGASGNANTANGVNALFSNITGSNNTANGVDALHYNTTGNYNTANGSSVLYHNTTGIANTATGVNALYANTTGYDNTANGYEALLSNATGYDNTVNGFFALFSNTTGYDNTANGVSALQRNTAGGNNTAEGFKALFGNTGSNNIGLGSNSGSNLTTGSDNIDIGALGVAAESNTMRIGSKPQTKTFIAGIRGITTLNANAVPVVIDSAGQLGTVSSSRRFKSQIKPMDQTSEAILSLKPVTFHYKSDSTGTPQFGLIAEEVAKVNPDLVVRDGDGEIYTVRYDAVNAMLLNEFLKAYRKIEEQEATIAQQRKGMEVLAASLKEQAAQIQKVSAQLEAGKPAPQMVGSNP